MNANSPINSAPNIQPSEPQPSRQTASPHPNSPRPNTTKPPSSSTRSSKDTRIVSYPHKVIYERFQKTVLFSGENGDVFSVICDL